MVVPDSAKPDDNNGPSSMKSLKDRKTLIAAVSLAAMIAGISRAGAVDILPHVASYDVNVRMLRGFDADASGSGIDEWRTEDHCETWMFSSMAIIHYEFGQRTEYTYSETLSFEAKDGSWFRFQDDQLDSDGAVLSSGEATAGKAGRISIEEPLPLRADLPDGTFFPMQQTIDVLERAEKGERFMNHVVFDGWDGTATSQYTTFVESREESDGHTVWNVKVSIFSETDNAGPDWEISARLRDDGVSELISYNNGDMVFTLTLTDFNELPASGC